MRYILKKIIFLLLTVLVALTINFLLPRLMPGDPIGVMISKNQVRISEETIEALETAYGINEDENLLIQYIKYIKRVVTGDFGVSTSYYPSKVIDIIKTALPWTLGIVGASLVISFFIGTLTGMYSAWRRKSVLGNILTSLGLFFQSFPYFWIALVLLFFFAFKLQWFPLSGPYSASAEPGIDRIISIIHHSILPILANVIISTGGWLLLMRNNMINVISEDYIDFAVAKGLKDRVVIKNYITGNAILPSFTAITMSLGYVIGGNVFTEIIFSYPGLGFILYQSVISLDYKLMETCFLFITITILVINFIADLLYAILDPRIRTGNE